MFELIKNVLHNFLFFFLHLSSPGSFPKPLSHKKEEEPAPEKAPRLCPYCLEEINEKATRCPHCAAELPAEEMENA